MKVLILCALLAALATCTLAQGGGGMEAGGGGMEAGGGGMEAGGERDICSAHSSNFQRGIKELMHDLKDLFDSKLRFAEREAEGQNLMRFIGKIRKPIQRRLRAAKRDLKKRVRQLNPCQEHIKLNITEEKAENKTFLGVQMQRNSSSDGRLCQGEESWVKLEPFEDDGSGETDLVRLMRHHPDLEACNNNFTKQDFTEQDQGLNKGIRVAEISIALGEECQARLGESVARKVIKVEKRVCNKDMPNQFQLIRVDGFDDVCPDEERSGCQLPLVERLMKLQESMEEQEGQGAE